MSSKTLLKIVFMDRDGTMIYEPPGTKQVDELSDLRILPGVMPGLQRLLKRGYRLVMVSNQDGLGTRQFPKKKFQMVQNELLFQLKRHRIKFYKIFICPHFAEDHCACRKPKTGLVEDFLKKRAVDWKNSFVIGDRGSDLRFAENLGVRGYKMKTNGSWQKK